MLKFVGNILGLVGIPGIPARDIGDAELDANRERWAGLLGIGPAKLEGMLIKSGCYLKKKPKRKKPSKSQNETGDILV